MHRWLIAAISFGLSLSAAHPAEAANGDYLNAPPEGAPASHTGHMYQYSLGGCGFGVGQHPANADDLPMGGTCHKKPKPAASPAQGGPQGLAPGHGGTGGGQGQGNGHGPDQVGPGLAPPPPPPPSPAQVADHIAHGMDPADGAGPRTAPDWRRYATLVGLPTYLWVEGADPVDASGTIQGVAVTVHAEPVETTWHMGEGHDKRPLVCDGVGRAWRDDGHTPPCGWTYQWRSTRHDPEGRYQATATVRWAWTWTSGQATGTLADTTTALPFTIKVQEAQAVTN